MRVVKAGSMQWSKHKVQRISCIENTKLESKREGNASTFCSPLLLQYKYGYIVIMCDNLDVEGKERCGLEGQGLNTGSEVSTRD